MQNYCPELISRACINATACDFRAVPGARSEIWLFQMSDAQRRIALKSPRPVRIASHKDGGGVTRLAHMPISTYGLHLVSGIRPCGTATQVMQDREMSSGQYFVARGSKILIYCRVNSGFTPGVLPSAPAGPANAVQNRSRRFCLAPRAACCLRSQRFASTCLNFSSRAQVERPGGKFPGVPRHARLAE